MFEEAEQGIRCSWWAELGKVKYSAQSEGNDCQLPRQILSLSNNLLDRHSTNAIVRFQTFYLPSFPISCSVGRLWDRANLCDIIQAIQPR